MLRMAQGSGLHFMMFLRRLPNYVAICAPSLVLNLMCWGAGMKDMREIKWINPWPWSFERFFSRLDLLAIKVDNVYSENCPWWTCFRECATLHLDTISSSLHFSLYQSVLSCSSWQLICILAISPSYALRYVDLLRRLSAPHILLAVGWDHELSHSFSNDESHQLSF